MSMRLVDFSVTASAVPVGLKEICATVAIPLRG
jgi:hypothetical protein